MSKSKVHPAGCLSLDNGHFDSWKKKITGFAFVRSFSSSGALWAQEGLGRMVRGVCLGAVRWSVALGLCSRDLA
jgi:hypothetical protein